MTVGTNWPEMAQNSEAWSCMIDNLPALHAAQTAEQQGESRAASSPLRPAALPRVFPLTTRESNSSSNGGSFIKDSSSSESSNSSNSSSDSDSNSDNDNDRTDDSDEEEQRARASAAKEQHTPRAKSARIAAMHSGTSAK